MGEEMWEAILNGDADVHKFFAALQPDVQGHARRVADGTVRLLQLAQAGGLCEEDPLELELEQIRYAVLYHDIGLVMIPERVLCKQEELTCAERRVIQRHAGYGAKLLDRFRSSESCPPGEKAMWRLASEVAVGHHERWDGKGYPFGTLANAAPVVVRATTIVDAYDAITRGSSYCMPLPHEYALVEILDNAGTQFDPQLADIFIRNAQIMGGSGGVASA